MKILYLVDVDLEQTSGVATKVSSQVEIIKNMGHEVHLLSLISLSFFDEKHNRLSKKLLVKKSSSKFSFLINLYKSSFLLKALLSELDFDIVYMRYRPYDILFKSAIKHKSVIAEMNTVYEKETKTRSMAAYLYYTLFKRQSFRSMDGFICVSDEIRKKTLECKYTSLVIANGIMLQNFTDIVDQPGNVKPKIVFIGSPNQVWHGLDKFIYLSTQLEDYDFHIIGSEGQNGKNLFYHGYLGEEEAFEFIKKCDVGISSTAMHRLSMEEASPLKSRQYLALGLPIIYAYNDTDLVDDYLFALKLPNEELNIYNSVKVIQKFIEYVYNNVSIRKQARAFAVENLDIRVKEEKRLQFMENILNKKGNIL